MAYTIAQLDDAGKPVKCIQHPGEFHDLNNPPCVFTTDRAKAWQLADEQTAKEQADIRNALNPSRNLAAIELN
ncbi:MAG: hypothetical protein WAO15_23970 [Mycobacterium sp.]